MKREDWQKEVWWAYQRAGQLLYHQFVDYLTFRFFSGTDEGHRIEYFAHNSPPPPTLTA